MSQALQFFQMAGKDAFSQMVSQMAPYFSTIDAKFEELKPHYAEVALPFRREITNHLGTVHAIAMCNAAELVAGTMTDVSIPAGARWIPKGMTVEYVAKAKTDLKAVADGQGIDFAINGDVVVPVVVTDTNDQVVFTARITMNIKQA